MKKYGYVRVSTRDQNIGRQIKALKESGEDLNKIFIDRSSGKDFNRIQYKKMVARLKEGDQVFVKSIDRLGRNYDQIIDQWNHLTKNIGAHIIVLDFPLLDTRQGLDTATGKLISDLVLQILSYVAQVERENTKQRQEEGIRVAQDQGVKFGRPKIQRPEGYQEVKRNFEKGLISLRAGAQDLGISHTTLNKWLKEDQVRKRKKTKARKTQKVK